MICRILDSELLVFCQTDHAHLSGELLSLWRDPELLEHPRREDLLFAIRRHDNGWQEADAAPLLHPAGDRPHDFMSVPASVRRAIWERGSTRFATERPYVALLITEHARHLLRPDDDATEPPSESESTFLETLDERRASLLDEVGLDEAELRRDYCWLRRADFLSLVACNGWEDPFEHDGVRGRLEGDRLRLDPFSLAGPTTFGVAYRRLERRPFAGDGDLSLALAACPWERWPLCVQPV